MANDLNTAREQNEVWALKFPGDGGRLCLSTMFDTEEEAREFASRCQSAEVIRLTTAPPDRDAMGRLVVEASGGDMVWQYRSRLPGSSEWRDCSFTERALYDRYPSDFEVRKLYTAPTQSTSILIDFKQATDLLAMFGGEPNEITLATGGGHSGRGLYASYTDMPEDGAIFLGVSDQEAMPDEVTQQSASTKGAEASVWQPAPLESIPNCLDGSLKRAAHMLRSNQHAGDAIDASRLEYLRKNLATPAPSPLTETGEAQIEAAAKVIAACFDYPWEHMPEQGRNSMRRLAKAVAAALTAAQPADGKGEGA